MSRNLENVPIALIGGGGFIGHGLAIALKRRGANVHVIDNLGDTATTSGDPDNDWHASAYEEAAAERVDRLRNNRVPIHAVDARQYDLLNLRLNRIKPCIVVHLASAKPGKFKGRQPDNTFDHDLRTLENALDWSRGNVELFLYCSTTGVYGPDAPAPVTEGAPCEPRRLSDAMKFSGEQMVLAYHNAFDMSYTICRIGPVWGPRSSVESSVHDFIVDSLLGREPDLASLPADVELVHVDDVVNGLLQYVDRNSAKNQIINLTGRNLIAGAEILAGLKRRFRDLQTTGHFAGGCRAISVAKAEELLDFAPTMPLELGLDGVIDWYKGVVPQGVTKAE